MIIIEKDEIPQNTAERAFQIEPFSSKSNMFFLEVDFKKLWEKIILPLNKSKQFFENLHKFCTGDAIYPVGWVGGMVVTTENY